ncbi:MAG: bifunctional glutamate N-acetyltransferase/amino-acid acetyltransferase ArgJ [Candidatus Omnitrophota bacterium]|nr:bifunctional glutamate N-acetyltransferase/amino-acid acetyltransferase ArgJ [Candidatus Omnitrophota bacterium]
MKEYKLPKGFFASGVHCGVKRKRRDLALFYSEEPCNTTALFTRNRAKAAPVILAQKQLKKNNLIRAVVVNSGNANCMTGKRGMKDAVKMAGTIAELLKVAENEVLVSSTGIIGKFMPMDTILKGLPSLVKKLSLSGLEGASEGIMTTDRLKKIEIRFFSAGGKPITMTAVAKGAGMIKPDMATMLCYVMTDARVAKKALEKALKKATEVSFNAITVDGDMSTNDTVMLMANGKADNKIIKDKGKDFEIFQKNLTDICTEIAKLVVRDGEGANKLIEVRVKGARSVIDAKEAAGAIASSMLVKCAVLGGDPNWGRIASAVGASKAFFDINKLEIILDGVTLLKNSNFYEVDRRTSSIFKSSDVLIEVNLHNGKKEAVVFSCDISKKYITFNSFYTT